MWACALGLRCGTLAAVRLGVALLPRPCGPIRYIMYCSSPLRAVPAGSCRLGSWPPAEAPQVPRDNDDASAHHAATSTTGAAKRGDSS